MDHHGQLVTLAGAVYQAAVEIAEQRREWTESGQRVVEDISIQIAKDVLYAAVQPTVQATVEGKVYILHTLHGSNAADSVWTYQGQRILQTSEASTIAT